MFVTYTSMKTYLSLISSPVWLALAALYWAAATVLHEAISNTLVVPFKNRLGAVPTEYAFVVLTLCGIGGLLWLTRVRAKGKSDGKKSGGSAGGRSEKGRAYARWLLLLAATALCSTVLMVTRIEMAHFPQYAILATLLRLGGLSPASAYLVGQCGSIMDEGRQYFLHPRYTGYFDWNDLIINSVGLCIGLLLMQQGDIRRSLSRTVACLSGALLSLATGALLAGLASGLVRAYVPLVSGQPLTPFPLVDGSRVLALFLREPPTFWQTGPFGQYHVMGVAEGMLLYPLCSALLFFCCCYRKNIS